MPSEDTKTLEFNQYQKSDKAPFIIYADFECITEKIDGCNNNPENCSVPKKSPTVYHFIIKELADAFKKQFTCLGEDTEKYITFAVPTEK